LYALLAVEPHDEASFLYDSYDSMINYGGGSGILNVNRADSYKTVKQVMADYLGHYATQRPNRCTHIKPPQLI
jgi:hypothetical protein